MGNYSVKNGYQLKIFMWKASKNLLRIVVNLWKKKVLQDPQCQKCRKQEEFVTHALLNCNSSKKKWTLSIFGKDAYSLTSQNLMSGLKWLAKKKSKVKLK